MCGILRGGENRRQLRMDKGMDEREESAQQTEPLAHILRLRARGGGLAKGVPEHVSCGDDTLTYGAPHDPYGGPPDHLLRALGW